MTSRSLLLSLTDSPLARALFQRQGTRHPLVRRFVAGDQLVDALQVVRTLHESCILGALDYLGEDLHLEREIEDAVQQYMEVIKALSTFYPDAYVSIKLTAIGLLVSKELARTNLRRLLEWAKERGNLFVRVDMEGSQHTQNTLDLVYEMHASFPNIGTVVQSYLRRTDADIEKLLAAKIPLRLVKGAYAESPAVAFSDKSMVDRQYRKQMFALLDSGIKHAIATHDVQLIRDARVYAKKNGLPPDGFEFEMLLGIRRDLQQALRRDGYSVRVYIPYGEKWYPYFTRRLAERPANLRFLLKNLLKG